MKSFKSSVSRFFSSLSHLTADFSEKKLPAIKDFLHYAGIPLLFALSFLAGAAARVIVQHFAPPDTITTSASSSSWGLSFQEEGKTPVGNASAKELAAYNAYYSANPSQNKIYLTFDCGYENGNTPLILKALQNHNVKATFFAVGNFVKDNPKLIKEMVAQGHIVGNHTLTHPDMSGISSMEDFRSQLEGVEKLYKEVTGESMTKFYRPPQGIYNIKNLSMAKELGYKTFFWSLAYVDWYQDKQPSREEAFDKLLKRIHPGAIVLLHNTSSTNGQILDELLGKWEEMGYTFGTLEEF